MKIRPRIIALATLLIASAGPLAVAGDDAAKLGGEEYTCFGGLRAGTDAGVAEYTGKFHKTWPGMEKEAGYVPGPYADEQPILKITADNYKQHEQRLTEGMKALFAEYPDNFYMNVYPNHRDFAVNRDALCEAAKYNADNARLVDQGLGVEAALGAPFFPFPETGLQALWNAIFAHRAWSAEVVFDTAAVYNNKAITWGKNKFKTYAPLGAKASESGKLVKTTDAEVAGYFFRETILPARSKGEVAVGYQPLNFSDDSTQAWQYKPGIRRVRKAPEVGFDYPVPPSGLRTSDGDSGFNGSPERYNWKLVGRKAMYMPYNNFRINDPDLSYDELITPNTINPEYLRYELHRVWVVEGTLKDGFRHIYNKRRLYIDEDGWRVLAADNWDDLGKIFRVPLILWFYSQQAGAFHRGVSVYHDLSNGAYVATYLVNEAGSDWWQLNQPMRKQEFSPEAALRAGQ